MTQEEYLLINSKGFEGDIFLKEEIEKIIRKNKIDAIIETGSFRGATTKHFSAMAERVYSVEISQENMDFAQQTCEDLTNIQFILGSSKNVLPDILERERNSKLFLFLDAHWYDYCPLRDELKAIKESGLKPCIAIHDFMVPGHPELGYDTYKGQPYQIEWIKDLLLEIYNDNFLFYYNSKAEGAKRGVIFINC